MLGSFKTLYPERLVGLSSYVAYSSKGGTPKPGGLMSPFKRE